MRIVDRIQIASPPDRVFTAAADVERWPAILPHYRWVRMLDGSPLAGGGIVEMAAWRPFGLFKWPTWWVSEMDVRPAEREVRYRHIRGITTGMEVVWRMTGDRDGTAIELIHEWDGPAWPVIRRPAAEWVIMPVFVHGIASRTLAGIRRHLEAAAAHG